MRVISRRADPAAPIAIDPHAPGPAGGFFLRVVSLGGGRGPAGAAGRRPSQAWSAMNRLPRETPRMVSEWPGDRPPGAKSGCPRFLPRFLESGCPRFRVCILAGAGPRLWPGAAHRECGRRRIGCPGRLPGWFPNGRVTDPLGRKVGVPDFSKVGVPDFLPDFPGDKKWVSPISPAAGRRPSRAWSATNRMPGRLPGWFPNGRVTVPLGRKVGVPDFSVPDFSAVAGRSPSRAWSATDRVPREVPRMVSEWPGDRPPGRKVGVPDFSNPGSGRGFAW
jgi:hypothetical protein